MTKKNADYMPPSDQSNFGRNYSEMVVEKIAAHNFKK